MEPDIRASLLAGRHCEAFKLLLAAYRTKVIQLAYSILGNRALAEEAAQEAFIRIWKSLARFRGDSSISTWVYAIARNVALTARRTMTARPALSLDDRDTRLAAEITAAVAERPDHTPDLMRLVRNLPEKYQQVVALFYIEEKSYEEVSRILDMPMGTVKTYLYRARKELTEAVLRERGNQPTLADRRACNGLP